MPFHHFELLRRHIRFSRQPKVQGTHTSQSYRCMLVEDLFYAINEHRRQFVSPSYTFFAGESISRWYGVGRHWIDVRLPHYVQLEKCRKAAAKFKM